MGYAVIFVSVTNGDAGHQTLKGKELAKRRFAEAQEAGKRLGVTYDLLDNHDGLLMPTLEVRLEIIKKIREWNADVVIAPYPNYYHPDHRYTGVQHWESFEICEYGAQPNENDIKILFPMLGK
jgi:LmbE family N-acetylglucosaminyl deacetylase